jgi:hypothetical protein
VLEHIAINALPTWQPQQICGTSFRSLAAAIIARCTRRCPGFALVDGYKTAQAVA